MYSPVSYCVHRHTRHSVSPLLLSLCRALGLQGHALWTAGSSEPDDEPSHVLITPAVLLILRKLYCKKKKNILPVYAWEPPEKKETTKHITQYTVNGQLHI